MAGVTGIIAYLLMGKLGDEALGVNARIATILADDDTLPQLAGIRSIVTQNVSPEISDKAGTIVYPALLIYCDKLSNQLREKFRDFSGTGKFEIAVRASEAQI